MTGGIVAPGGIVPKPWGHYIDMHEAVGYKLKTLVVMPGKRLSLQMHRWRGEFWLVTQGVAVAETGRTPRELTRHTLPKGSTLVIGEEQWHRLSNFGQEPLHILEVQFGERCEESDIERFEDDFGRVPNDNGMAKTEPLLHHPV